LNLCVYEEKDGEKDFNEFKIVGAVMGFRIFFLFILFLQDTTCLLSGLCTRRGVIYGGESLRGGGRRRCQGDRRRSRIRHRCASGRYGGSLVGQ